MEEQSQLNLFEVLKDCPKGTELYSIIYGKVFLDTFDYCEPYSIGFRTESGDTFGVTKDGKYDALNNGECVIFPSKEERDWSKFKFKKPKFNPKTLKVFDKVLVKNSIDDIWCGDIVIIPDIGVHNQVSLMRMDNYALIIPYNEDTKHLVGTTDEAPEYYRYWKD